MCIWCIMLKVMLQQLPKVVHHKRQLHEVTTQYPSNDSRNQLQSVHCGAFCVPHFLAFFY